MRERIPTQITVITRIKDQEITLRLELELIRGNSRYLISVADTDYVTRLREANERLGDFGGPDNILPLQRLEPLEAVRDQLSQIPTETLNPYLQPITKDSA